MLSGVRLLERLFVLRSSGEIHSSIPLSRTILKSRVTSFPAHVSTAKPCNADGPVISPLLALSLPVKNINPERQDVIMGLPH
jgi:hypothetical protein